MSINGSFNYMNMDLQASDLLLIPGPTPVPDSVLKVLASQPIAHRSQEFSVILESAIDNLKWLAQTDNDAYILTASGTGAMEASVVNFINPGDKVLCLVMGVFGERLAQIAQAYGARVVFLKSQPGKTIETSQVEEALTQEKNDPIKAVLITHNETSTGVTIDLQSVAAIAKKFNTLVIVDAITSFGATNLPINEWDLDVVISGSQKALMLPPGLSVIFVSKLAWAVHEKCITSRFYLDLSKYKRAYQNKTTPFTPNVSLTAALNCALQLIKETGRESVFERHKKLKDLVRLGLKELDLIPFVENYESASVSVTSVLPPEHMSVAELRAFLKDKHRILIADGQNELKGQIFRIGHMGYIFERDIYALFKAMKQALMVNQPVSKSLR